MHNKWHPLKLDSRLSKRSLGARLGGFSLIELLITLTVAGILIAVGIPLFSSSIKNSRLTGAVNEFVSAMNLSRSEASKRRGGVVICHANNTDTELPTCGTGDGWTAGWVIFADDPGGGGNLGVLDAGDEIIAVHGPLSERLFVKTSENSIANLIAFNATGFAICRRA